MSTAAVHRSQIGNHHLHRHVVHAHFPNAVPGPDFVLFAFGAPTADRKEAAKFGAVRIQHRRAIPGGRGCRDCPWWIRRLPDGSGDHVGDRGVVHDRSIKVDVFGIQATFTGQSDDFFAGVLSEVFTIGNQEGSGNPHANHLRSTEAVFFPTAGPVATAVALFVCGKDVGRIHRAGCPNASMASRRDWIGLESTDVLERKRSTCCEGRTARPPADSSSSTCCSPWRTCIFTGSGSRSSAIRSADVGLAIHSITEGRVRRNDSPYFEASGTSPASGCPVIKPPTADAALMVSYG